MDETSAPAPPQRARFLGPQLPGVVPTIAVIICVIVFLAIQTSQGETVDRLQQWGWGPASAVWHGKVWLLVTSAFVLGKITPNFPKSLCAGNTKAWAEEERDR